MDQQEQAKFFAGRLADKDAEIAQLRADLARVTAERDAARAEAARLAERLAKADEVVTCARTLGTYQWEDRLDDSKTSDDAKTDARELGIAVWHYDEWIRLDAAATPHEARDA